MISTLTSAELSLVPNSSMQSMLNVGAQQKSQLQTRASYLSRRKDRLAGTLSTVAQDQGRRMMKSFNSSKQNALAAAKLALPVASLGSAYQAIIESGNDVVTNEPYGPDPDYNSAALSLNSKITAFYNEVGGLDRSSNAENSAEITLLNAELAQARADLNTINAFMDRATEIMRKRADGTFPSPAVNLTPIVSTYADTVADFNTYVQDNIVLPFNENLRRFGDLSIDLQLEDQETPPPMFDLTYGPPVSVKGQFVLSRDGLYYDSRGGGLPQVSGTVLDASAWELEYPPNLGGKGIFYGDESLFKMKGTVFSEKFVSNEELVLKYYQADDILQNLEKNKSRQISIVSGQISDLIASGHGVNSAMVLNHYNNVAAVAGTYDSKIQKRKKQVQLVALFGSGTYSFTNTVVTDTVNHPKNLGLGEGVLIELIDNPLEATASGYWKPIERVPLNDFTFLKGKPISLTLEEQKEILLFSEDLDDIILPVIPKFLVSAPQPFSVLDKFSISPVPEGEFVQVEGTTHVSGSGPFVLSLTDRIVTDSMICGYNFIKPDVVDASSDSFNLDNFVPDSAGLLNARLVGSSIDYVFPSGLGIPYFRGSYYNRIKDNTPYGSLRDSSRVGGTYVELPTNDTNAYAASAVSNALYLRELEHGGDIKGGGFTFDYWVHMPSLLTMTDTHRYKLIIANENSGGKLNSGLNPANLPIEAYRLIKYPTGSQEVDHTATDRVHGLMMGFRDKGGATYSSGVEFAILPTVSQNRKIGTGTGNNANWSHSVCIAEDMGPTNYRSEPATVSSLTETGIKLSVSSVSTNSGKYIGDTSSTFMHMCVAFDYVGGLVKTYLDGELLSTDTLSTSLMVGYAQSLMIPSFTDKPSDTLGQEYEESWTNDRYNGPRVNLNGETFTPWIIGGGFTDGIESSLVGDSTNPGFLGYNTNTSYYGEGPNGKDTGSIQQTQHVGRAVPITAGAFQSGLNGYLGSFKLYGKALSKEEAQANYEAQKGFFKNIVL